MFGTIFAPTGIVGTLLIIAGIIFMVMKQTDEGQAWFSKKFGKDWREKNLPQFLDWPLLVAGPIMFFKDQYWYDGMKIIGLFLIFTIWQWWRKRNIANTAKENASNTTSA